MTEEEAKQIEEEKKADNKEPSPEEKPHPPDSTTSEEKLEPKKVCSDGCHISDWLMMMSLNFCGPG